MWIPCLHFSQEMPRPGFITELDGANATWLTNDVAMFSTKTGELLLLTLVYDGRLVLFCIFSFASYTSPCLLIWPTVFSFSHCYYWCNMFYIHFCRIVQRLELSKSRASVLTSVSRFLSWSYLCMLLVNFFYYVSYSFFVDCFRIFQQLETHSSSWAVVWVIVC